MLVDRIIKLSALASKDPTRTALNGVWLTWDKSKLLIEVTDGHKASREFLTMEECPKWEGSFFVECDKIPLLKIINKQHKYIPCPISYDVEADLLSIGMNSEVVLKRPTSNPPPFKQVYTIYSDKSDACPHTVIGLNAKYLLEIAEALKDGKNPAVKLIIKDNQSPITVVVGQRNAVLMPCRV